MIVYQSGKSKQSGYIVVRYGFKNRFIYHSLRIFASSLVTFSVVSLLFYFLPILKEELGYLRVNEAETKLGFGDLIQRMDASDAISDGVDPFFSISIPKIDAKANIISNVDSNNSNEYLESLKRGVAHAKGTNFPGQNKLVYLFSHSTNSPLNFSNYNAVFYLLRKLEKNDKIYIYFLNKKYVYQVIDKRIASADDITWLKDAGDGEKLVLQTCDPPGTSFKRLIIIAKPI